MRPLRLLVLAGSLLLAATATASAGTGEFAGHHRQVLPVLVVRGLSLDDLQPLAADGAVGLLVPSAGPRTSASLAFAGIVRGVLHNARLGTRPDAPVLIHARVVDSVPESGRVIVLGLPPNRQVRNDARYPIAVLGACRGVLVSSLTRLPGLVSAGDVARTALRSPHRLGCRPDANAASTLRKLEQRIEVARSETMAATVIVLALLLAFALLLPSGTLPALAATLVANLGLGLFPGGGAAGRLTLFALCIVAGGVLWRRAWRTNAATGLGLLSLVGAYAAAMAIHPGALSLAPLGPELTARFYGVSNVLETLLLVPILAGTALVTRRLGPVAFAPAAALGLVTIAENRLGADGGGAVVVGTAAAVLAVGMTRAGLQMLVPALALAALAVLALLNLDAAVAGPDHLSGALDGGVTGLATSLAHRVPLAYARIATQWYFVFPLGALALLLARTRAWPGGRDRRALAAAFGAAILASLLVNDSPGPVTLAALGAFVALEPTGLRREVELLAERFLPRQPAVAAVSEQQ